MKKLFFISTILVTMLLIGCNNKEEPKQIIEEEPSSIVEEIKTVSDNAIQKFSIDNLMIDKAWDENKVVKYDINYEKEVLRLIKEHNNAPFDFSNDERYELPVLEIVENGVKYIYAYSGDKMVKSQENVDNNYYFYNEYIVQNIEDGIKDYEKVINEYKSIGDLDFKTYMENRYGNNKNYGLNTNEYFDGKTEEVIKGYLREDNRLGVKIKKNWGDFEGFVDVIVDGIDGEIASVIYCGSDDSVYDLHAYILTMDGDVYDAILNHELFQVKDPNPKDGDAFYAKKIDVIKNAFAIDYVLSYPYMYEGVGESRDGWYSALTYEGRIFDLLVHKQ